ncbi:hypothetical protein [Ornithinibacillus xuwenensis]|uniref:DUF4181 domain-containing protein n=1 Tax=Ornithinibacillus xuwenensis TaxID=3144668 RepID=A0ABU9XIW4_9BACI
MIVFLIVLLVIIYLIEKLINRLLGVEKQKLSDTLGKTIDRWGRGIILVSVLIMLWFVIDMDWQMKKWFWILYIILLVGFQSILEFIYLRIDYISYRVFFSFIWITLVFE